MADTFPGSPWFQLCVFALAGVQFLAGELLLRWAFRLRGVPGPKLFGR